MGLRNLLVITGDPSQLGDYPGVHDVYSVDVFELVRSVARMAEGFDCAGNRIGEPPAYFVGVAVNPGAEDLEHELDRLHRKVEAGARFAMSQVFFEWGPWERLLDRAGGSLPVPALIGVWPLSSHKLALRLHYEVPGIFVPDDFLTRLETAGADAARVGMEQAVEMLQQAPDRAAGAYLIAPFRNPEDILHLLDQTAD
jgi:homocysteine S-methyltransferase